MFEIEEDQKYGYHIRKIKDKQTNEEIITLYDLNDHIVSYRIIHNNIVEYIVFNKEKYVTTNNDIINLFPGYRILKNGNLVKIYNEFGACIFRKVSE